MSKQLIDALFQAIAISFTFKLTYIHSLLGTEKGH